MSSELESAGAENGSPVERVLTVYSNPAEEFVTEHPLLAFNLAEFRKWFNEDGDSLMYLCYVVAPKDVEFLAGYLAEPVAFDFNRYCYFVEAYVSDEEWKKQYAARRPA